MSTSIATLHSSISARRALEWQRAWVNEELGYTPSDEELALLEDARNRPEYYLTAPKGRQPKSSRSAQSKPYRLPRTIV
jgi:hypothetical protein